MLPFLRLATITAGAAGSLGLAGMACADNRGVVWVRSGQTQVAASRGTASSTWTVTRSGAAVSATVSGPHALSASGCSGSNSATVTCTAGDLVMDLSALGLGQVVNVSGAVALTPCSTDPRAPREAHATPSSTARRA